MVRGLILNYFACDRRNLVIRDVGMNLDDQAMSEAREGFLAERNTDNWGWGCMCLVLEHVVVGDYC